MGIRKDGIKNIMNKREDMSDFLFHFIKGPNAFETLSQILRDGAIKDIQNKGYICFTETPLLFYKPL